MPILQFNGKFKFQLPYFNNDPTNDARKDGSYDNQIKDNKLLVKFDPNLSSEEIHQRLLTDPTKYFEFEFLETIVSRITFDDGTNTDSNISNEPIVGKFVFLKGFLVDLAPHLQRGQLYAADIRISDTLVGRLNKAIQSDVYKSIKNTRNEQRKGNLFNYSGYFETELKDVYRLTDPFISEDNSRYLRELKDLNLKIYFNLNRYDINTNKGEVCGYISSNIPLTNNDKIKVKDRKLFLNNAILGSNNTFQEIINDFQIDIENSSSFPRATYEIQENNSLLILRYMDIIPFIDYNYSTLEYKYYIHLDHLDKNNNSINQTIEIDRTFEEIKLSGGIKVIQIPNKQNINIGTLRVSIRVRKSKLQSTELLFEPEWEIVLDEYECIKIYSDETKKISGKIFHQNKIHIYSQQLQLEANEDNPSSPFVVWFEEKEVESIDGNFETNIITRNLENSKEITDPVTKEKVSGDLPWDRYYGNELIIKFKDIQQQSNQLTLLVRVIHKLDLNKNPTYADIQKIFSYYSRYFPWLHVRIDNCTYKQFLNLGDRRDLLSLKENILVRLFLQEDEWYFMPRSRDLPKYGKEIIKKFFRKYK